MAETVSREEMTAAIEALREALSTDRTERVEQMVRFEAKFDNRMDAIYQMLADSKERSSNLGARLTALESAHSTYMHTSDKRFSDLLTHFDARLTAHKEDQTEAVNTISGKQDRNWGWVMALIGAVVLLMVQSFFGQFAAPKATPVAADVSPVAAPKK